MALLFFDGFSHYDVFDYAKKWGSAGISVPDGISLTGGRNGGGCAPLVYSFDYLRRGVSSPTTLIAGFALKIDALPSTAVTIVETNSSTAYPNARQVGVQLNTDGTISLHNSAGTQLAGGLSTFAIEPGEWCFFECKFVYSTTVGEAVVRVDRTEIINITGVSTLHGVGTYPTRIEVTNGSNYAYGGGILIEICDFYLCDGAGTDCNDFLGDVCVDYKFPISDGTPLQFTTSAGSDHFELVNDQVSSLTNYVTDSTAGHRENFAIGAFDALESTTIFGVQVTARVYTDTSTRTVGVAAVSNGTTVDGTAVSVGTAANPDQSTAVMKVFEKDPDGNIDWTLAALNAAQFGVKTVT
jgi:hypothetical protein